MKRMPLIQRKRCLEFRNTFNDCVNSRFLTVAATVVLSPFHHAIPFRVLSRHPTDTREFKITTTATATGTSLNKRFNEQNNACARAL